ncbi:MAG: MFS transporter [Hamadaea sp.]|nr:MFS transporter [Hamadaea sp.]
MTALAEAPPCLPSPLWTREFRLYFTARAVSLLGDAMLPVALTVGMLEAGYGATGVGYAMAAWMGPAALLVLFGGVLADRFSPRRMMIGADAARLLAQVIFSVVFLTGATQLWQILVLQAINGAAAAMFQPGTAGMMPLLTTDLQRGNATLRVAEAITTLAGPAVAGVLILVTGVAGVFAVDALTFAVSGLCLLLLRVVPAPTGDRGSTWRNLAEGWAEFRSRTWLWGVISIWAVYGLIVFGPAVPLSAAVIVAGGGSTAFAVVTTAFGAGTIIGGLAGLRLRPVRPLAAGVVAMFGFAALPLSLAVELPLWVIAAGHLLAGAGFAFWGVMWSTTVQSQIPGEVLNRVYAYDVAGSIMFLPLGRAVAGPIAAQLGERQVLGGSGVIAILLCLLMLAVPAIRRLRRAAG